MLQLKDLREAQFARAESGRSGKSIGKLAGLKVARWEEGKESPHAASLDAEDQEKSGLEVEAKDKMQKELRLGCSRRQDFMFT